MEIFSTQLYEHLTARLTELEQVHSDPVVTAREAVKLITEALHKLREHFLAHPWEDPTDEIRFFKQVKPRFQSRLIYYLKLFHLESHAVTLAQQDFRAFLEDEMDRIRRFFACNQQFCQYYKTGACYLDECFFLRNQVDLNLVDEDFFMALDPEFSTVHSYKVSRMLAYNALNEYIKRRLQAQEAEEQRLREKTPVNWTATKADLVELIYALHAAGAVNHSRVEIHLLARVIETIFGVKLGNCYRAFQDIRSRKKNRTPFLDTLKEMLLQRMETAEVTISGM